MQKLSNGGFLLVYEKDRPGETWIRFRYYTDLTSLQTGTFQKEFDAPRTLAPTAEGTPNIYAINLSPDIDNSRIEIGFHYYRNQDTDRLARGVLTNFSSWQTSIESDWNSQLESLGIGGNIGDRDYIFFKDKGFNIQEAQLVENDWSSWRSYLYDYERNSFQRLELKTHNNSTAFANPSFTNLTSSAGKRGVVATFFIPSEGAGPGEAGTLIFYKEY